jgi:hypothetical protein
MAGRRNHNQRGKPKYDDTKAMYYRKGIRQRFNRQSGTKIDGSPIEAYGWNVGWPDKSLGGDITISIKLD